MGPGLYCTAEGCQPERPCTESDVVGELGDVCASDCGCPEDFGVRCCLNGKCQDQALSDENVHKQREQAELSHKLVKATHYSLLGVLCCCLCSSVGLCWY